MAEHDVGTKGQRVHVLGDGGKDLVARGVRGRGVAGGTNTHTQHTHTHLAVLDQLRTLRLSLTGRVNVRDAHKLEQRLAVLVVLLGHLDQAAGELLRLLHIACAAVSDWV